MRVDKKLKVKSEIKCIVLKSDIKYMNSDIKEIIKLYKNNTK